MRNKNQSSGKNKSLPKETFIKTISGERHGAVAGNASTKNLNKNGSERLNRFALTQSYSAAKLQQNTETTKKKVQNLINNGYIKHRKNRPRCAPHKVSDPLCARTCSHATATKMILINRVVN